METIDIIFLILIAIGAIQGLMKGAFKQLAFIIGLVVGLLVARALFGMVADKLMPVIKTSLTVAQILSFILIWVFVPLLFMGVASVLSQTLKAIHMGWINRLGGAVLGAFIAMVMIGIGIRTVEYIDPESTLIPTETKEASSLYQPMKDTVSMVMPVIERIKDKIHNQ